MSDQNIVFLICNILTTIVLKLDYTTAIVAELKEEIKTIFNIPADREIRLWNNYLNNTYECLARLKDENTLQDAGFYSGNTVVAETKKEDGSWQREDNNTKSSVTFHLSLDYWK